MIELTACFNVASSYSTHPNAHTSLQDQQTCLKGVCVKSHLLLLYGLFSHISGDR